MSDLLAGMELERRLASLETWRIEHDTNEGAHANAFNAHGMSPGPVEDAEELAAAITETAVETVEPVAEVSSESLEGIAEEISDAADEAVDAVTTAGEEAIEAIGEAVPEPEPEHEEEPEEEGSGSSPITGTPVNERAPKREHMLHRQMFKSNKNEA